MFRATIESFGSQSSHVPVPVIKHGSAGRVPFYRVMFVARSRWRKKRGIVTRFITRDKLDFRAIVSPQSRSPHIFAGTFLPCSANS